MLGVFGNDQWRDVLRKECGLEIFLREGTQKSNRQEKARLVVASNETNYCVVPRLVSYATLLYQLCE